VVEWYQLGPVELIREGPTYGLDARYTRMGYLLSPGRDPSRQQVQAGSYREQLQTVLGKVRGDGTFPDHMLWPTDSSRKEEHTLAWIGTTNRYFAVAASPIVDPQAAAPDKSFRWVGTVDRVVLNRGVGQEVFGIRIASTQQTVAPGTAANLDFAFFSGPLDRKEILGDALPAKMGMAGLIVYNLGGMCGFCTFDWMTGLLRWVLGVLHPVTKWSQLKMGLMGKKMAAVAPKQKTIQEKFKGDNKKIQDETAKLWREEGVNPFGCVAIIPSFLQMPVWFALYALLFFAVELRHTPAFYGIFEKLFGGPGKTVWFLGDLAEPDRLVNFGKTIVNLWGIGAISSFNILPLALGVVFFLQQKYMTPPTAATLTPEQEMQQKIIKWMTVVMFPVFMYNAPAGLTLYFFTNSTLAIIETRYIRSHLDKYEKQMEERRKAKPGTGGGFFSKLLAAAEAKQREIESQKGQSQGKPPRKKV
jgi:YidC/Oxa1 family membrane protein insertase